MTMRKFLCRGSSFARTLSAIIAILLISMALAVPPSAATRQRLERLDLFRRRLPHMSQTALAAVCDDIRANGLPEPFDRHRLQGTRDMLRLVQTPYGPLVRGANLINATTEQPHVSVEFINIWALLAHIITKGGGFAEFIRERHTASPSSARKPWTCSCFC